MKIKILTIIVLLVIVVSVIPFVNVSGTAPDNNFPAPTANTDTAIANAAAKAWGTVVAVVQILAFAAILFAGVRYMFASANTRADIKKGLGILVLGSVLVFATATVVSFVTGSAGQIL